jgi:hypothetical protein
MRTEVPGNLVSAEAPGCAAVAAANAHPLKGGFEKPRGASEANRAIFRGNLHNWGSKQGRVFQERG